MNNKKIFENIINKKTPSKIIYQDKKITAFNDISPKAPIHILIIPNKFIKNLNKITKKNLKILSHMIYMSKKIAKKKKINKSGYRIIINCNKDGGQKIKYLHIHLIGGKKLKNF
ncbi:MAG: HIT domain-containing protein [Buchnera aphidicola (Periphyllus lyropictus)]|uniref:HIT domain-containing protein n=1 Tax=Buchnera aphidicola TaxID=9 RepID=UPI001EBFB81A|nr:HIT domain-containing protein [Buchnera aphidicola]NIH16588.1 HIT domain-containing protein [Buchnera aphidicola (Periphyllus lyropictus)]USS94478.1 HIT domain-containing protein [Buchnera aphidicola (Periphyllus lyropictus)]